MVKNENSRLQILQKLVGDIDENLMMEMEKSLELFLHPRVSLFMPVLEQCPYALQANHSHPGYSFIYYMQPVQDFIVEGQHMEYSLQEGKCFSAMSPGIPHQEIPFEGFESFIAIVVEPQLFEDILKEYTDEIPVWKGEAFAPNRELLEILKAYMIELQYYKNETLIIYMEEMIVHMIVRSIVQPVKTMVSFYNRMEVDKTIQYMNQHIEEKITLEMLAGTASLSIGQFSRVFRETTGDTPIHYLNEIRLKKSKLLLKLANKSITEIAMECGFVSPSYFTASFQKAYGISPTDYEKKCRQHNINRNE